MMWNASVNAICDRAHGTGLTASTVVSAFDISRAPLLVVERAGLLSSDDANR